MLIFGIPLTTICKIATGVGNALSVAAVLATPYLSKKNAVQQTRCNIVATYDDAIMAIMESGMISNDKAKTVMLVPKDGTSALYKAIINVIESSMLSSDKIETIKHICKN